MIQFLTERVRAEFHSLPIESQRPWVRLADELIRAGKFLTITSLDRWPDDELEIGLRIDEKSKFSHS